LSEFDRKISAPFNRTPKIQFNCAANYYEGWNFNSGNYLFTTDSK